MKKQSRKQTNKPVKPVKAKLLKLSASKVAALLLSIANTSEHALHFSKIRMANLRSISNRKCGPTFLAKVQQKLSAQSGSSQHVLFMHGENLFIISGLIEGSKYFPNCQYIYDDFVVTDEAVTIGGLTAECVVFQEDEDEDDEEEAEVGSGATTGGSEGDTSSQNVGSATGADLERFSGQVSDEDQQ